MFFAPNHIRSRTPAGLSVTGLEVNIDGASWVAAFEYRVTDTSDVERIAELGEQAFTSAGMSMADITAGNLGVNSNYGGATPGRLSDGSPDITVTNDAPGSFYWSLSGATDLRIIGKWSSAISPKYVDIAMETTGTYSVDIANIVFKDQDGAVITPIQVPTSSADYYQSINRSTAGWLRFVLQ